MPSSIDDPSAGLLGDEEAPVDCHSAVRGVGVVTLAFGGLVITNVCVLLFKELSQIDGEYLYNPASALCMAEIRKFLVMLCSTGNKQAYEPFLPKTVPVELSWAATGLALLYAVYNQLTFVVLTKATASTVALFKATTPTLVALLLWLLHGERINKLQWAATVLQMAGLVLVAEAAGRHLGKGETVVGRRRVFTGLDGCVRRLSRSLELESVEGIDTPMPILNMFLYSSGACFNYMIFALKLAYSDQDAFFGGYATNVFACLVVVSNSLIGLSTSVLYKYGDAIISKYAAACSAAVLLVLEIVVWRLPTSSTNIIGAFIAGPARPSPETSPSNSRRKRGPSTSPARMRSRVLPRRKKVGPNSSGRGRRPRSCKLSRRRSRSCVAAVVVATARRRVGPRRVFERRGRRDRLGRRRVRHGGARVRHKRAPDAAGVLRELLCFLLCWDCGASIRWYAFGFADVVVASATPAIENPPVPTVQLLAPNSTCLRLNTIARRAGRTSTPSMRWKILFMMMQ